jgi:hypothetical protein
VPRNLIIWPWSIAVFLGFPECFKVLLFWTLSNSCTHTVHFLNYKQDPHCALTSWARGCLLVYLLLPYPASHVRWELPFYWASRWRWGFLQPHINTCSVTTKQQIFRELCSIREDIWGRGGIATRILNLSIAWRWVTSFTLEEKLLVFIGLETKWSSELFSALWLREKSLPPVGIKPRLFSPQPRT